VHAAAEQKRLAIKKVEKFSGEGVIKAVAARPSYGVPKEVTTLKRVQ
jgi:hypothetical protein